MPDDAISIASNAVIQRSGGWLCAEVGDNLVMMNTANDRHIGLTETGKRIWELLETPQTMEVLCAGLGKEYDADPQLLRADVAAFIRDLVAQGAASLEG